MNKIEEKKLNKDKLRINCQKQKRNKELVINYKY